jgi:uncharacterized protein YegP (UPF0339 family)
MIAVVPDSGRWRLVGRTGRGADVLATGPLTPAEDERAAWHDGLERLRDADGELVVGTPDDRHYRWVLRAADGTTIAASPPVYRDAVRCREAFAVARDAAGTALAGRHRPAHTGAGALSAGA